MYVRRWARVRSARRGGREGKEGGHYNISTLQLCRHKLKVSYMLYNKLFLAMNISYTSLQIAYTPEEGCSIVKHFVLSSVSPKLGLCLAAQLNKSFLKLDNGVHLTRKCS